MIWLLLVLGIIAFFIRIAIRISILHRLLKEDYIMVFSFCCYISIAVVLRLYLSDIYNLYQVGQGLTAPTVEILAQAKLALHADGVITLLVRPPYTYRPSPHYRH